MAGPGGGAVGGGDVVWYRFDEPGGERVVDSSAQGNDGRIFLSPNFPIPYTNVTVDLAERAGSSALYLVFPKGEARINWLEFRRPGG